MVALTLGDARSDAHALVGTLAVTAAEVEAVTLADARGDAHALVDTQSDTLAEVEAVTLGDTRGHANALVHSGCWSTAWLTCYQRRKQ